MNFDIKGISICVVTWNSAKYLELLLKSIRENTILPYEILIYDNASSDTTQQIIYTSGIKKITCIFGQRKSIMSGWNRCIENANYDWIYTPHTDMFLFKQWDSNLARSMKKLSCAWKVLACSRSIEKDSHVLYQISGRNTFGFDALFNFLKRISGPDEIEQDGWDYLDMVAKKFQKLDSGIMVTAPRQPFFHHKMLWEKMGHYNEKFYSFGEDDWKVLKAWDLGVRYFPMVLDSIVFHFSGGTNKRQNVDRDKFWPYDLIYKEFRSTHPNLLKGEANLWPYLFKLLNYYKEIL